MEIEFKYRRLAELCLNRKKATKELGNAGARKLGTRLSEIDAASDVTELVAGKPHPLTGDQKGQFSLQLDGGRRLVFEPLKQPVPVKDSGGIDWQKVEEMMVVYIGDYHG